MPVSAELARGPANPTLSKQDIMLNEISLRSRSSKAGKHTYHKLYLTPYFHSVCSSVRRSCRRKHTAITTEALAPHSILGVSFSQPPPHRGKQGTAPYTLPLPGPTGEDPVMYFPCK